MKQWIAATVLFSVLAENVPARSTLVGRARDAISAMSAGCEEYKSAYGIYPPGSNWFAELAAGSEAVVNTNTSMLPTIYEGNDPWGNPYVFRSPGRHNPDFVDIYSLGADGKTVSGGDDPDDLNNWNLGRLTPAEKLELRCYLVYPVVFVLATVVFAISLTRRQRRPERPASTD
jgi:type II secretory pathway pseudopilin PulG